jgi:hypothetical protein
MRQNLPRLFQQQRPGLGQFDASRQSTEQQRSHLLFELTDLLAQRRLLDAESFGGSGEMSFLGDGQKMAEMP